METRTENLQICSGWLRPPLQERRLVCRSRLSHASPPALRKK